MRHLVIPVFCVVLLAGNACVERTPAPSAPPPQTPAGGPASPATERTAPCPTSKPDTICTKEYRPVVCDGCTYANPCLAGAAGFRPDQCTAREPDDDTAKKCPEPAQGIVCTTEYAPVLCQGCRYSNACVAGAAGFAKEQCTPDRAEE